MRINVEKCKTGTSVKIFMKNTEAKEKRFISNKDDKAWSDKRTFGVNLSKKGRQAAELIIGEILNSYTEYSNFYKTISENAVIEKVKEKMKDKLDDYQCAKIGEIVENIAIPIIFNKKTSTEVKSIKDLYNLSDSDLLISLVGGFGYGKTTTIKKLLNFDDNYHFLLVDNGRTTIYPTHIRGMIVNDNDMVTYNNENGEKISELASTYEYKNIITLHTKEYIYENIIVSCMNYAFDKFQKSNYLLEDILIIKEFIKFDKCLLDSLFGIVNEENIKNGFYQSILEEFHKYKDCEYVAFMGNEDLRNKFFTFYENTINDIFKNMPEASLFNKENGQITFKLKQFQIENNIDEYYKNFTDNSIKGGSFRICVNEIYLETNFCVNDFLGCQNKIPTNIFNYNSFVFADTVGCGHEQSDKIISNNLEGKQDSSVLPSMDIVSNFSVLNQSDIIILIDKANQTMTESVMSQLKALEDLGFKNKVMLIYTYYNQFIKNDMFIDSDRENQLKMYLDGAIKKIYPSNKEELQSKKSEIYYNHFCDGNDLYDSNKCIVYLKGLVERVDNPQKSTLKQSRRAEEKTKTNQEDDLAKKLNAGFENSECCLFELIEKIIYLNQDVKVKESNKISIKSLHKERAFISNYDKYIYNSVPNQYLQYQFDIYHYTIPHHATTKALCYNASVGNPVHYGVSITLRPVENYIGFLQSKISDFLGLQTNSFIIIETDDDNSQIDKDISENFILDKIRSTVNIEFTNFAQKIFVNAKVDKWKKLYNDEGPGVKVRRSNGIYELLEDVSNMEAVNKKLFQILLESIDNVIEEYTI